MSEKHPNAKLNSWFERSGWSKGELARQVNSKAHASGAHHVSTDTSRVRRWLDGEQPREPIPQILCELFAERLGCTVCAQDLGLRSAQQTPTKSGIDLPWAGPQTVQLINDFSRTDLMLDRRGFLGTSLALSTGSALVEPMQRWLLPLPGAAAATSAATRPVIAGRANRRAISQVELQFLEEATDTFRSWDAQCGGGLRRKAVVGQLHEVTDLLREAYPQVRQRLFRVTAELAHLAGWMSFDVGMQPSAQKYFVLALHAAKEAGDRPLGAYVLHSMSRQMIDLGRPDDALALIHLAQYGSRGLTTPRTQALLHAMEGRAYANIGEVNRCYRAVGDAEDTFAEIRAEADGDPSWIAFFSEAELNAENAHSYRDLANREGHKPKYATRACPVMQKAVQLFHDQVAGEHTYQRSYALNLIGLSTVYVLQGNPEAAATTAHEAAEYAKQIRSERVNTRLRQTAAEAVRRFGNVGEVRHLSERLAAELPVMPAERGKSV